MEMITDGGASPALEHALGVVLGPAQVVRVPGQRDALDTRHLGRGVRHRLSQLHQRDVVLPRLL